MTIDPSKVYYMISDTHCECEETSLVGLQVMCSRAEEEDALFIIAGDFLDGYIRDTKSIRSGLFADIIKRIEKRTLAYVIGNHDSMVKYDDWMIMQKRYPMTILSEGTVRWYVEHGHLVGKHGWIFEFLDMIDERTLFRKIVRWVLKYPALSHAGRRFQDNSFRGAMIDKARSFECQVVIAGHNHVPEIYRERGITYVNPGTAVGKRVSYAVYRNGKFTLEYA